MKNWKKCMSLLLTLVLCLGLAACGDDGSAPETIKNIVLNSSVEYDYSGLMGTWLGEENSILVVEHFDEYYNSERFHLYDLDNNMLTSGNLQYVEEYGFVYFQNEQDGIAHRSWFDDDDALNLDAFGLFNKVSGDVPGETIGDIEEEEEPLLDMSGYTGYWRVENEPYYFAISDTLEWGCVDLYGEQIGSGYVVAEDGFIKLNTEGGSTEVSLWKTDEGFLIDEKDRLFLPEEAIMFLPTPEDELVETAYFPDGFPNVSIKYPAEMTADPQPNVHNALNFNAVMGDGTDDYYSNILIAFQPISGFDSYMEQGATTAKTYMGKMLDDFMKTMYGDKILKLTGSDFEDNGDYYSITGHIWFDSSIFVSPEGLSQPVRGCMEVRYYGPTDYALVAVTVALEDRLQNYVDICNHMLDTLSYSVDWSTAPKSRSK